MRTRLSILAATLLLALSCDAADKGKPVTPAPQPQGRLGGLLYFASYGNTERDVVLKNPYIAGAVLTFYWSEVEPQQGVYDWSRIDGFVEKWGKAGKKVALRPIWCSTGLWPDPRAKRPTPAWLWQKGAKYLHEPNSDTEIPLFWDPVYQEHALKLMTALNARYGNDERILFFCITPGYETIPYHYGKTEEANPGFLATYLAAHDSAGRTYSAELWRQTGLAWIDACTGIFTAKPTCVSLNTGGLPGDADNFDVFGQRAFEKGVYLGQNGIKGSSYTNPNGGRYKSFMKWEAAGGVVFQEMALAAGNVDRGVGTLMEVMQAALRIKTAWLNVYAVDVEKGTKGSAKYDPASEEALKFGAANIYKIVP